MGKGFKHGGGGGSDLNFRVVGGLEPPASPKANDIWLNTDTTISSWVFSTTEPHGEEGMVWLSIGLESSVAFNALKKNKLAVYPVSASQYVGGAWVNKAAQSWQGGKWVSWWVPGTLFADGIDDTALTGGWASKAFSAGSGIDGATVDVSVSSNGVSATLSKSYKSTFIGTKNKIDTSGFNTLRMEFSEASRSTGSGAINACLYSDEGYTTAASAAVISTTGVKNLSPEIDVSKLSGTYYIGYFMWAWDTCVLTANMTKAILM